ncbi:MAG TPA: hypothetical protein VFD90_08560 [Gaiellales bacterium]|jgi:hypothetical protein|nr:hypothetical protein [Gaiellales bacterium]
MASPFGRAAARPADAGEPEAEAWHIGRGPATKSPLWRVGCWLIGLAGVAVGLRCALWVLGGSAPFQLLVSSWLILLLLAGSLMTVPYGLSRLRGAEEYEPPRDAFVIVAQKLSTVLWVMIFWRSLLSVGDEVMTRIWNAVIRRWIAAHPPPPPPDPLEAEIRHSIDNDPGWWARGP